jgi:hypothetical protein
MSANRLHHFESIVSSPRGQLKLVKPQMRLERTVELQHRGTASSQIAAKLFEALRRNIESSMTSDSV